MYYCNSMSNIQLSSHPHSPLTPECRSRPNELIKAERWEQFSTNKRPQQQRQPQKLDNATAPSTTTTNQPSSPTMSAVTIEPAAVQVPAAGGTTTHQLQNTSEVRYAFKVKSTNNEHYRVNPVFGFVEAGAGAQLEVTRTDGPPKSDDRLEILFLPIDAECADPKAPFTAGTAPEFKLDVPMTAE